MTRHRFLVGFTVVVGVLLLYAWPCIVTRFSSPPPQFTALGRGSYVLALYGKGLCTSCPPGKLLLTIRKEPLPIIFVPASFSADDIRNFRDVFGIQGQVVRGDGRVESFLRHLSRCRRLDDWKRNYLFDFRSTSTLKLVQTF